MKHEHKSWELVNYKEIGKEGFLLSVFFTSNRIRLSRCRSYCCVRCVWNVTYPLVFGILFACFLFFSSSVFSLCVYLSSLVHFLSFILSFIHSFFLSFFLPRPPLSLSLFPYISLLPFFAPSFYLTFLPTIPLNFLPFLLPSLPPSLLPSLSPPQHPSFSTHPIYLIFFIYEF